MVMKRTTLKVIEIADDTLTAVMERAEAETFETEHYETVRVLGHAYRQHRQIVKEQEAELRYLRKLVYGSSTERSSDVLGDHTDESRRADTRSDSSQKPPTEDPDTADDPPKKRRGHGRNGADDYPGAERVHVTHDTLQAGNACPNCEQGTLYAVAEPGVFVSIVGQAPLQATVYELEKLRCNLCGAVFTAPVPADAGTEKYDATAGTMIGLLKYGSGLPFNRLQRMQNSLGIPLPAATQWEIVHGKAERILPAHEELIRQAAQGDVLHHDDTGVKILEWMGKRAKEIAFSEETASGVDMQSERTGLFTSGIVSACAGHRIALFLSGRQHAGENLRDVLAKRAEALAAPIQMCDALSRNMPSDLKTVLANCLAHGRRQFVDIIDNFPDECRHVIEALKVIYKNDAKAREEQMSPEARLEFHQTHSQSTMTELQTWLKRQIDEHLVEPNSALGQAISYMLRHWGPMTLFLRQAGAPLDNNICERALKKAILHRKNSLFYKTDRGARVGDLYMSLIYSCDLNGANPFDYLTELDRHADELAANPSGWMPWNYRATLAAAQPSPE
jgi:transposase